jgi:ketosteroid isomerase-like protein
MGTEENLRLIRARYEAVNSHDFDRFQGFYGNSIKWEDSGLASALKGPAAVRKRLEDLTSAFPDLKMEVGPDLQPG